MRGILTSGAYLPYRRLDRSQIDGVRRIRRGQGHANGQLLRRGHHHDGRRGRPSGAAGRARRQPRRRSRSPTCAPAYADRTNATAIHAALRLDTDTVAVDYGAAVRSASAALLLALRGPGTTLVVSADVRTGLPGSGDEAAGGDGAAALLVGDGDGGTPVLAEFLGGASASSEFVDRWRAPGDARRKLWEERFGEIEYVPLGEQAWNAALQAGRGRRPTRSTASIVTGLHARAVRACSAASSARPTPSPSTTSPTTVGNTGAAHAGVLLAVGAGDGRSRAR